MLKICMGDDLKLLGSWLLHFSATEQLNCCQHETVRVTPRSRVQIRECRASWGGFWLSDSGRRCLLRYSGVSVSSSAATVGSLAGQGGAGWRPPIMDSVGMASAVARTFSAIVLAQHFR